MGGHSLEAGRVTSHYTPSMFSLHFLETYMSVQDPYAKQYLYCRFGWRRGVFWTASWAFVSDLLCSYPNLAALETPRGGALPTTVVFPRRPDSGGSISRWERTPLFGSTVRTCGVGVGDR
jgi:hypothetical protein